MRRYKKIVKKAYIIYIKYLHELSDREIADLLGVTLKVVNVRIFRARKKLQNLLREECGSNEQTKSGQSR